MTAVALLAAFVLGLASAVAAFADVGRNDDASGPGDISERVDCRTFTSLCAQAVDVLERLPYPRLTLEYEVVLTRPVDDWRRGATSPEDETITLCLSPDMTGPLLRQTFAHEVAHAIHQRCSELLDVWRERPGLGPDVPDHSEAPHDYDSVAEDFAEAFAGYMGSGMSRSTVGEPFTDEWLQRNSDVFLLGNCPGEIQE
ncbi:MAG: hypothetical protein ACRDUY_11260 [Nitriliruptorales bacterium]